MWVNDPLRVLFLLDFGESEVKGKIKKKVDDKGFGFIEQDGDDNDIFFHATDCGEGVEFDALKEGDAVEFGISQGDKGPRATNLQLVS